MKLSHSSHRSLEDANITGFSHIPLALGDDDPFMYFLELPYISMSKGKGSRVTGPGRYISPVTRITFRGPMPITSDAVLAGAVHWLGITYPRQTSSLERLLFGTSTFKGMVDPAVIDGRAAQVPAVEARMPPAIDPIRVAQESLKPVWSQGSTSVKMRLSRVCARRSPGL